MTTPRSISIKFVAAWAALAAAAGAQEAQTSGDGAPQTPPATTFPCEQQEKFRAFDFWVGEWEVHTADGRLAGKNVIESSQRGCVLVENWAGVGGSTGISLNYLDTAADQWVQVWTDASGSQITIRGGMTDEGMLLEGQIHYTSNGVTAPFRGLWTPQPDGRVRQYFEQSNDGGKTWEPWFEGFYSRAGHVQQADGGNG